MKKRLFTLMLVCIATINMQAQTTHEINVSDFAFSPTEVTNVSVNDIIKWVWVDGFHTTTSTNIPDGAAPWDEVMDASNTEFTYMPTIPGEYNYHCTPHAPGMAGSFIVSGSTNIRDSKVNKINIFPNPVENDLYLSLELNNSQSIMISIYDLLGKLVLETRYEHSTGDNHIRIPVAKLRSGYYFVKVDSENGNNLGYEKIIKR